jgi:hypothetical protein
MSGVTANAGIVVKTKGTTSATIGDPHYIYTFGLEAEAGTVLKAGNFITFLDLYQPVATGGVEVLLDPSDSLFPAPVPTDWVRLSLPLGFPFGLPAADDSALLYNITFIYAGVTDYTFAVDTDLSDFFGGTFKVVVFTPLFGVPAHKTGKYFSQTNDGSIGVRSFDFKAVPEPASGTLMALGLLAIGGTVLTRKRLMAASNN